MKRYRICFLLFLVTSVVCLAAGFGTARHRSRMLRTQAQEEMTVPAQVETREVVSQQKV